MRRKLQVQVVAAVVILVFAGGITISGGDLEPVWLRFFGAAVFVAVLVLSAWDRFLWKWSAVQRLQSVPPDLNGTWKGTLTSLWRDTWGSTPPPKTVYLVVHQTASTASVVLHTDESRSGSTLASVTHTSNGPELQYLFVNRPAPRHERASRMHNGAALLNVVGRPARKLDGRYWTDRDSRGELSFTERRFERVGDFAEGENLFGSDKA